MEEIVPTTELIRALNFKLESEITPRLLECEFTFNDRGPTVLIAVLEQRLMRDGVHFMKMLHHEKQPQHRALCEAQLQCRNRQLCLPAGERLCCCHLSRLMNSSELMMLKKANLFVAEDKFFVGSVTEEVLFISDICFSTATVISGVS